MEKIHGNTHVFVLSCIFLTCKHKNMHDSMYFFHLELTFTPHYILTDKGLLGLGIGWDFDTNYHIIDLIRGSN